MFVSICSVSETECAENAKVHEIVTGICILMGWHNTQETTGISFLAAVRVRGTMKGRSMPAESWTLYIKMSGWPLRGGDIWMRPEWWEEGDQSGVGRDACSWQVVGIPTCSVSHSDKTRACTGKPLVNYKGCASIHFDQSSFWVRWPWPTIPKRLPRAEGLFLCFFEIFQQRLSFFVCGISFLKASILFCRECT